MDLYILLAAIFLAYGGIILIYFRMRRNEARNKISNLMLKGTMSMRRGNMERALFYFSSAYEYSMNNEKKADAAEALFNMGHLYAENGEIEAASKHWEHAHKLYIKVNDIKGRNITKRALKSINQ